MAGSTACGAGKKPALLSARALRMEHVELASAMTSADSVCAKAADTRLAIKADTPGPDARQS